jgi:hypothetical protein
MIKHADPHTPLSDQERAHLTALEDNIREQYLALSDIAQNMQEIGRLDLYRELYPTFDLYCQLRWGMKPNNLPFICELKSIINDVKGVIDTFRITQYEVLDQFMNLNSTQRKQLASELAALKTPITSKLTCEAKEKLFPELCLGL